MFNDEIPEFPVDDETMDAMLKIIAENYENETHEQMDADSLEKIYDHINELEIKNILLDMVLTNFIIMRYDTNSGEVVYSTTKYGNVMADEVKKRTDDKAIDNLLKSTLEKPNA